ncbi:MAG TPA: ATP synthase F1 subunit delta [Cytophagaceae bacterium]
MHESRVASRYAKSLLELAKEQNVLDAVFADMELFTKVGEENPQLVRILKNPIITQDKKLGILTGLFKGKVHNLTLSIFDIITRKGREGYLFFIAKDFIAQYRALKGITTAEVVTSYTLTPEQRNSFIKIVQDATNNKVELIEKVDSDIIGGYILKIGDKQIDETIKSKLNRLKNKFTDNSYIAKY